MLFQWLAGFLSFALLLTQTSTALATEESEVTIGRKFSLIAQSQLPLVRDSAVRRYVQRLGQRIVTSLDHAEFPYRFGVVQEPHINAFSVPGGYIYIHTGLIQRVQSDDELASVLGHEIAHIQGHHFARQQQDTKWLSYAGIVSLALALINPVLAAGASSAAAVTQLKYQRFLEEEADHRGLQYMTRAGFDPHAMPRFFNTMHGEERLNGVDVPPYFRSHPLSQERLSYIERTLRTMQWNQKEPTDTFELRRVQAILRAVQGNRSRVIPDYERQLAASPDNPQAMAILGTVLLRYHDWERAKTLLEQAGKKGVRLDTELGIANLRLGLTDQARQLFLQQREVDPHDAEVRNQLCGLFLSEGSIADAEQECREALANDPYLDEAYITLARIAQQRQQSGEARLLLAQAMELQGRLEAAFNQYQQAALLLGPKHAQAEMITEKSNELEELRSEIRRAGGR
ncbi:MAG: M48 family metalloprotease [Candidatus Binatia bacterium]